MMFRKISLFCLAVSAVFLLHGADIDRKSTLEKAVKVTEKNYPDADSVILDDVEHVRYQADGTDESDNESYLKILTEKGRRANQTMTLHFNKSYGTAELKKLEIIRPDGTVVPVDIAQNSREAISSGQMGSNIYDPNQCVRTISIPDLKVGDILYSKTLRKETKSRIPDVWCGFHVFRSTSPVLRSVVEIDAPASRPLAVKSLKGTPLGGVKVSERIEKDRVIYRYEAENMPQLFPEPEMPPWYFHTLRLLTSTAPDWPAISKWYYKLCRPRLNATNSAMRKKVEELTRNAKTDMEKIRSISSFVAKDIRYMGLTLEDDAPGYEPHDVSLTFDKRYGVCRDKAALLAAMLELAGFKAYPTLFYVGEPKDEDIPNNYFNHAITAVELKKGEYILIDPTAENSRDLLPASLAAQSYLVARPEGDVLRTSPEIPASENTLQIVTKAKLSSDGTLSGKASLTFNGINDQMYREAFARWTPKYRHEFFTAMLKRAIPGAELKSFAITPKDVRNLNEKLVVALEFTAPNAIDPALATQLFAPPLLGKHFGAANFVLRGATLARRSFPMNIASTCGVDESLELELPDNLRIERTPEYSVVDEKYIKQSVRLSRDKRTLRVNKSYGIHGTRVRKEDYVAFKRSLGSVEREDARKLMISRTFDRTNVAGLFPDADILIEKSDRAIELGADGRSWTARTHSVKRILTYAGLKDHSELKVHYNPAWESVALEYAAVTDPDGTLHKIDPKAINTMDAAWVASAPRYPAGKILVANFPNVKVGSVIEYKLLRRAKNREYFAMLHLFQGDEPAIQDQVKIVRAQNTPLYASETPPTVTFTRTESGKQRIETWQSVEIPPIPNELGRAPLWSFAPFVAISTMNAETYAGIVGEVLRKATKDGTQANATARRICTDAANDMERIERLRKFVARDIRLAGPGFNQLPLSAIGTPDVTMRDRYGNSTDRAILLYTMLEAVGIRSNFVLAADSSNRFLLPDRTKPVNLLPLFSSVLLAVQCEGRTLYLNDGNEYATLGANHQEDALLLAIPEGSYSILRPERPFSRTINRVVRIGADGTASVVTTDLYFGSSFEAANRRHSELTPEELSRELQRRSSGESQRAVPQEKLHFDFKNYPGSVRLHVKIPHYAVRDGELLYFQVDIPRQLANLLRVPSAKRTTPFLFADGKSYLLRERIEIPKGYRIKLLPQKQRFDGVAVDFRAVGNMIEVTGTIQLPEAILNPAAYAMRAEYVRKLAANSACDIVLEPEGKK